MSKPLVPVAIAALLCTSTADANLLSRWSFDEVGGTVAADSIGDIDGTLFGNASFQSDGIAGGSVAIGLSGNGAVSMGDVYGFAGNQRFSVQAWIRTTSDAGMIPVGKHVSTVVAGWFLAVNDVNDGPPNEAAGSLHLYQSDVPSFSSGDRDLNDGQWHQIVAVRDTSSANEVRLYVDGERVPEAGSAGPLHAIGATSAPFMVGGIVVGANPTSSFQGSIDEVRIWDNALTDDEVRFFYEHPESLNAVLCGDANGGETLTASDALGALKAAVGSGECLACICDANDSGDVTATDALLILKKAVGQSVALDCPICIAGDLAKLRWEIPCLGSNSANVCSSNNVFSDSATLLGPPGTVYDVTLRFRGVVEQKTYTGGVADGMFYSGGTPDADPYNVYRLQVSEPPSTYYLNAGASFIQRSWLLDVTKTIPIAAGATVTLDADAIDNAEIKNRDDQGQPIVPAGVPPAPEPFDGQFIQMDVLSLEEQD